MDFRVEFCLFCFGAIVGVIANWAIYELSFARLPLSPLSPPHPKASPRRWLDYVPILGWLARQRDAKIHGRGFWIRPLLIELSFAVGAVFFYRWLDQGGLIGSSNSPKEWDAEIWYSAFGLLFVLLTIATFIDFDEQIIPDWVTVPGTLAALAFAIAAPNYRLPELVNTLVAGYEPIHFASPHEIDKWSWYLDWRGLVTGCLIVLVWSCSLMPMKMNWRRGWRSGVWLMWASLVRPRRRRACALRKYQRGPYAITRMLLAMGVGLVLGVFVVWAVIPDERWTSLLSALLGMGLGGGLVWAVRIIGSIALGQEAMGFGDVTLMAMIGAFVGWQAALIVFALAPFAAVLIAILQYTLSRNRVIAFGPYLALASVVLIIAWPKLWNEMARSGVFQLPAGLLVGIIGGALIAMALMLIAIRWFKGPPNNVAEE